MCVICLTLITARNRTQWHFQLRWTKTYTANFVKSLRDFVYQGYLQSARSPLNCSNNNTPAFSGLQSAYSCLFGCEFIATV